jgi:hypothetical protein
MALVALVERRIGHCAYLWRDALGLAVREVSVRGGQSEPSQGSAGRPVACILRLRFGGRASVEVGGLS